MAQLAILDQLSEHERNAVRDDSDLQDQLLRLWRHAFIGSDIVVSRYRADDSGLTIMGARYPCGYTTNPLSWNSAFNPPREFRLTQSGFTETCHPVMVGIYPDSTGTLMCRIRRDWRSCDVYAPRMGPRPMSDSGHVRVTGPDALRALRDGMYLHYNDYEVDTLYSEWGERGITLDYANPDSPNVPLGYDRWTSVVVTEHGHALPSHFMRERVGRRLRKAGIESNAVIDQTTDDMRALIETYLQSNLNRTLRVVEGTDVSEAYDDQIGEHSCMAGERSWITNFYADNPEHVKLAIYGNEGDEPGEMVRCLLWFPPNGRVVYDRAYSESSSLGPLVTALQNKYGDRLLPAWEQVNCTRVEAEGYAINGMNIPDNHAIPYFDNAVIKLYPPGDHKRKHECCVLPVYYLRGSFPELFRGFQPQTDYEGGPLINGIKCPGCDCTIDDEDELTTTHHHGLRCSDCLGDQWVWSEEHEEYILSGDAVEDPNGDYIYRHDAVWIESADVYVHKDELRTYFESLLTNLRSAYESLDSVATAAVFVSRVHNLS